MKKIIYCILGILFICVISAVIVKFTDKKDDGIKKTPIRENYVLNHDYYRGLTLENIISVEKVTLTASGEKRKHYKDPDKIRKIYSYWKTKKLGKKTNQSCDDNTTIYIFELKDNVSISIEQECNVVIINNERYLLDEE